MKTLFIILTATILSYIEPQETSVVVVDHSNMKTTQLSKDVWELDPKLKRTVDFMCEIDGISYYLK